MFWAISGLLVLIPSALCCGGNFVLRRNEEFTLQSPNYPDPFPAEAVCNWRISSEEGAGFNITCPVLDLVSFGSCKYNGIQITSDPFAMKICALAHLNVLVEGKSFDFNFKSSIPFQTHAYRGFSCVVSVFGTPPDKIKQHTSSHVNVPETQPALPSHHCNCGMKKVSRIVGGQEAELHEYPWQVLLNFEGKYALCGATLISEKFALTAAHCLEGTTADMLTVTLGEHDRTTPDETHQTIHLNVSRMIVHEGFDQGTYYNDDIALLELAEPVTFTAAISPACLPYGVTEDSLSGEMGIVTGWGYNETWGSLSPILREVELPMMTTEECRGYYEDLVTENMFCTYTPGKDSCKSDSGGPLVWSEDGSQYYLVGIVSWGDGCAREGKPGVYTKVTNYLTWIEMKTKASFCR